MLIIFILNNPTNYLLIILKAELGKTILLLKKDFIVAINVILLMNSFYAVNNRKSIINQVIINKKYKRFTYTSTFCN